MPEGVSGSGSVLLRAPPDGDSAGGACTRLLGGDATAGPLLFVTLSEAPDDRPVSVRVHSLTALLEHVEPREAFRFLQVLTRRVEEAGARAHYHVDPSEHDEQALRTLEPLFDATPSRRDGTWTPRTH